MVTGELVRWRTRLEESYERWRDAGSRVMPGYTGATERAGR